MAHKPYTIHSIYQIQPDIHYQMCRSFGEQCQMIIAFQTKIMPGTVKLRDCQAYETTDESTQSPDSRGLTYRTRNLYPQPDYFALSRTKAPAGLGFLSQRSLLIFKFDSSLLFSFPSSTPAWACPYHMPMLPEAAPQLGSSAIPGALQF